jgi:hypothetical protein
MFNLVREELNQLDPTILTKYGKAMSMNDMIYWMFSDEMALQFSGGGEAGKEEVIKETDPPTVKARAVFFPILIHELIKGVMEVMGTRGLPDDPRAAEMVMGKADLLPYELWDLRLGPIIWEKFLDACPERLFEDDNKHLMNYLFSRYAMLELEEFFELTRVMLRGDDRSKQIFERMVRDIETTIRNEDYLDEQYRMENDDDE